MTKQMHVYFVSENDALSAESALQRFRVTNMFVDTIPEVDASRTFMPVVAPDSTATETGTGTGESAGGAEMGGFAWSKESVVSESEGVFKKDDEPITHVLEIKLADDVDVREIVDVLKENNGYMLKELTE
ncbi:MAG TPA: hypothetical protein VK142_06750 [Bacillota bacterium]|nr:hypothetical protein [Bacillota bacterium]